MMFSTLLSIALKYLFLLKCTLIPLNKNSQVSRSGIIGVNRFDSPVLLIAAAV